MKMKENSGRLTRCIESGSQRMLPVCMYERTRTQDGYGYRGYYIYIKGRKISKYFSASQYGSYDRAYWAAFNYLKNIQL